MFENVLVGVDGSPNSRDAVALAVRLTSPEGRLTLVHVRAGSLDPRHAVIPGLLSQEREASARLLEHERASAGLDAELISVVAFNPGRGLRREAEERQADLLVVGSCSHGVRGRAMLGDDIRAALNGASCAVAIAARGYAEHPTPIARVGVGYDGSQQSKAALAAAREIAAPTRAAVHALQVVSIPSYAFVGLMPVAMEDSVADLLKQARDEMEGLPDLRSRTAYGLPEEELAAFGAEVDILVVGSRGCGPVRRLMLGSTSYYLQRHARCSLLVLPRIPHRARVIDPSIDGEPEMELPASSAA
jgi:nucleotide-binding universal stress UspA family protein